MMMRFLVAGLLAVVAAVQAQACSCLNRPPPLKALAQCEAVFMGEVIDITPVKFKLGDFDTEGFDIKMKVLKSWKGDPASIATVRTGTGWGDCGFEFTPTKFLVYAYRSQTGDGKLYTNICTRTRLLEDASEDLAELDGKTPVLEGPGQTPVLESRGRIDYETGYAFRFTLHNRLHQRIYFIPYGFSSTRLQYLQNGRWLDSTEFDDKEMRLGHSARIPLTTRLQWREEFKQALTTGNAEYINPLATMQIDSWEPLYGMKWRFGVQFVTEQEFEAGERIQDSHHFVWSRPFAPKRWKQRRIPLPPSSPPFTPNENNIPGLPQ